MPELVLGIITVKTVIFLKIQLNWSKIHKVPKYFPKSAYILQLNNCEQVADPGPQSSSREVDSCRWYVSKGCRQQ